MLTALPVNEDWATGLKDSRHTITVKQKNGEPVTVRFGGIAKVAVETEEERPESRPEFPGMPQQPGAKKTIVIPYRFARVDGNPQLFIVRADKYDDLFTTVSKLKDPQVGLFRGR